MISILFYLIPVEDLSYSAKSNGHGNFNAVRDSIKI